MSEQRKAVALLVLTAVLWSLAGTLIKWIEWNPLAIAGTRSAIAEQPDLVDLRRAAFHAGRTDGHAGHGETASRRTLREQLADGMGRDVPFDGVTLHFGGVAGVELRRHPLLILDGLHGRGLDDADGEAGAAQVVRPGAATAAGRLSM